MGGRRPSLFEWVSILPFLVTSFPKDLDVRGGSLTRLLQPSDSYQDGKTPYQTRVRREKDPSTLNVVESPVPGSTRITIKSHKRSGVRVPRVSQSKSFWACYETSNTLFGLLVHGLGN